MQQNKLSELLVNDYHKFVNHWQNTHSNGTLSSTLIISISDGFKRAKVITKVIDKEELINDAGNSILKILLERVEWATKQFDNPLKWLRIEWPTKERQITWKGFNKELSKYKRNYFRSGIAYKGNTKPWCLLTEMELNANACLYAGVDTPVAKVNYNNLETYIKLRHSSKNIPSYDDEMTLLAFQTSGIFFDADTSEVEQLCALPRYHGHRDIPKLNAKTTSELISKTTTYLANQVLENGRFEYGHFPCFGKTIDFYNTLRHTSSIYALIEGYEFCRDNNESESNKNQIEAIEDSITAALGYMLDNMIRYYSGDKAYILEENGEIKLGANAVGILALTKYYQVFVNSNKRDEYLAIAEKLANGILAMQKDNGQFVHILDSKTLNVINEHRVIYYDGEAAFGLMRLYGMTKDNRWIDCVTKAFDYFISAGHNGAHDHWLSYCSNELVTYKPEKKYFQFAVNNVKGYTDFIKNRITTFPTLLELSMAFHKMLLKLDEYPEHQDVLDGFDVQDFYEALHARANYLINGFFFPEVAMYFKKPNTILHGCFIRHHSFRVRIDDVEHYLSGWVAYAELLEKGSYPLNLASTSNSELGENLKQAKIIDKVNSQSIEASVSNGIDVNTIVWGGDVNLGRRQHYVTKNYGVENILNIPLLVKANFTIVNLECVVSVLGEQGRIKGEGGPYYYRARPEMVEILRNAGVNAVACANNHSGDYGTDALLQQKEILAVAGIDSVGTGKDKQAAFAPIYHQLANGVLIAIFSVDATIKYFAATQAKPGAAYIYPKEHQLWTQTYAPLFKEAKNQADLVLVAIHWGANGRATPDSNEYEIGHRLIDAGADAILGASAHQLQGIEIYREKPIIHDAGDLLFDAIASKPKSGGVFQLDISKSGIERVRFYPVKVGFGRTWQSQGDEAIVASRDFAKLCAVMGSKVILHIDGSMSIPLEAGSLLSEKPKKEVLNQENTTRKSIVSKQDQYSDLLEKVDYSQWSAESHTDLVMDTVPEDARIEPIVFGEMELVGVRTHPYFFNRRRMLWVESFWRINKAVSEDIRVHFRAKPTFDSDKMRPWGIGTEHDPCDWLIPTSKWQVGKVYRDFYGLRPPYRPAWEDGTLQLQVRVLAKDNATAFTQLPYTYVLNLHEFSYRGSLPIDSNYRQKFADKVYEQHSKGTWNATQLEAVTGGTWLKKPPEDWYVDSIVAVPKHIHMVEGRVMFVANTTDHRHRHEGYAKKPKLFDRHKYVAIKQKKLVGAIVSQPVEGIDDPNFPILQVDDPIKAWIELGIAARSRYSNPVIGITGTVGKSSSSAMLKKMLGDDKKILITLDNYNSRVGIPGTLASLSPSHDAAIIEISQGALWQKSGPISQLVRPNIALVTEIGLTQTRVVKTIEQAVDYKCRIFNGLSGDAIAVVSAHLPLFDKVLGYANKYAKKVVIYGDHPDSDIKIKYIKGDYRGSEVSLETKRGNYKFTLQVPTEGLAKSAIAAFAVIYAMGGDLNKACKQIKQYKSIDGRMQSYDIPLSQGKVTLIDDNWNAAYDSMINAFSLFNNKSRSTGRLIFVLGRLVDMGDKAKEIHQNLAEPLLKSQPDLVITHGQEMQYLRDVLPNEILGGHFEDVTALSSYIKSLWKNNDVILIKGSRNHSDFGNIGQLLKKDELVSVE